MPTMGSTLDARPLRSTLPTGRVTMRYTNPRLHPATPEIVQSTGTTSQVTVMVDITTADGETTTRKGGEARW